MQNNQEMEKPMQICWRIEEKEKLEDGIIAVLVV